MENNSEKPVSIWMKDIYDFDIAKRKGWDENSFTENNPEYRQLESACQIRQLTLTELRSLSFDELGYLIGRIEPDISLLGPDRTETPGNPHTPQTRAGKLKGNAIRAAFVLQEMSTRKDRIWTWGLSLGSAVVGFLLAVLKDLLI